MADNSSAAKRKRRPYTATACELCRRRKVRCQNKGDGSPCDRCVAAGVDCRYEHRKGRGKRRRREDRSSDGGSPLSTGSSVSSSGAVDVSNEDITSSNSTRSTSSTRTTKAKKNKDATVQPVPASTVGQPPAAMTTKHPLLRHKKRKTGEGSGDNSVTIHLSNNIQLWSEDQKHRILNTDSTHSTLLSIRSQLENNHRQIEDWRRDISSKQQYIDKKNLENERLISLYQRLESTQ